MMWYLTVAANRRLFLYGVLSGFFVDFLIFDVVLLMGFNGRYEREEREK